MRGSATLNGDEKWNGRAPQVAFLKKPSPALPDQDLPAILSNSTRCVAYVYFEDEPGTTLGGASAHPRRGAAHRRQHRQAAGAVEQATILIRSLRRLLRVVQ